MPRKPTQAKKNTKKPAAKKATKKSIDIPDIFALTNEQQAIYNQLGKHIDPKKNPVAFLELVKVKTVADKCYEEFTKEGVTIEAQNGVVMQHPSYKAYADCLTKMIRLYGVLGVKANKPKGNGFDLD